MEQMKFTATCVIWYGALSGSSASMTTAIISTMMKSVSQRMRCSRFI